MIINLDNPKPDKCCDFDNKLAEEVILSESYDQVDFNSIGMNIRQTYMINSSRASNNITFKS